MRSDASVPECSGLRAVRSNEVHAAAASPRLGNDDPDLYNLREGSVVIAAMRCIGDAFSLCLLSDVVETGGAMGLALPSGCRSVVDVRRACRSKMQKPMIIRRNAIGSNSVSLVRASGRVGRPLEESL